MLVDRKVYSSSLKKMIKMKMATEGMNKEKIDSVRSKVKVE